jgi:2-oxoglutarate dehydrogenase E1 component
MKDFSALANAHPTYIENMYRQYLQNAAELDPTWAAFFKGFDYASTSNNGVTTDLTTQTALPTAIPAKEFSVMTLIDGFRHRGHLLSTTNPIRPRRNRFAHLDLADWGLEDGDRNKMFKAGEAIGLKDATLQQILDRLNQIYGGNIGFEYSHIDHHEKRLWLREKIENRNLKSDFGLNLEKKRRILEKINGAVGMEEFLAKKYGAYKRFGLEGGEATIAGIDAIINAGADDRVEEVIIGMAHRGRLNVLANIMGKTYGDIFNEFEGNAVLDLSFGSGDVKYHLGFSSQVKTIHDKQVYLKLLPNPSHLEAVDAVMEGFARAKADILYDSDYDRILPIMIHGDASVAGQGIVYEIMQMSQLNGYYTGGTIHYVINNQVGFTTDFEDARSSYYASSVASVVQAPTFHVNGDDPEAVIFACELAVEYRQKFNTDVFIDMVCYRRNGHNEADNPEVTQPLLYKLIKNHPSVRILYSEKLAQRNEIQKSLSEEMAQKFDDDLQNRLSDVKQKRLSYAYQAPEHAWQRLKQVTTAADFASSPATGVSKSVLNQLITHLKKTPDGFKVAGPIERLLRKTYPDTLDKGIIDWATAELMAYGSILLEKKDVRLSGEDVKRGTFSHRNAVLFHSETNEQYSRLMGIQEKQGTFHIYNSLLSEYAVLGFEYGYAMAQPDSLVIWEAQFGDFVNGAQTIIDQFIAAGETKWQRQNGIVMLLPHGFEGQGPEHSSARMERFLQSCAENNMTIANITTPANFFHLLRRQLERPFRKPLIVMSPKSLLRHPHVISAISEFETGNRFKEVLDDANATVSDVKKVLFCTGKVYYDLLAKQKVDNRNDVAIVRIEQLYPFPQEQVKAIMKKYHVKSATWVQEEPANMGAWMYLASFHSDLRLQYVGRPASASPATGFMSVHQREQAKLVEEAFK